MSFSKPLVRRIFLIGIVLFMLSFGRTWLAGYPEVKSFLNGAGVGLMAVGLLLFIDPVYNKLTALKRRLFGPRQ